MDMRSYYDDYRAKLASLRQQHPENVVYVTSLYHRERNSTPGCTLSATCSNAARVLTDGTHREATQEEVDNFIRQQNDELQKNTASEQHKKQHYFVVVDKKDVGAAPLETVSVGGGKPAEDKANDALKMKRTPL